MSLYPVTRFSSDILLQILQYNSRQDCQKPFDVFLAMLRCSQVCQLWRRVATGNSRLWVECVDLSKHPAAVNHVVQLLGDEPLGPLVLPSVTPLLLDSPTVRSVIRKKAEVPVLEILLANDVDDVKFAKRFTAVLTLLPRSDCLILKMPYHGWMFLDILFSMDISHLKTLALLRNPATPGAERLTATVLPLNYSLQTAPRPWNLKRLFLCGCWLELEGSRALVNLEELTLQYLPYSVVQTPASILNMLTGMRRLVKLDLRECMGSIELPTGGTYQEVGEDAGSGSPHQSTTGRHAAAISTTPNINEPGPSSLTPAPVPKSSATKKKRAKTNGQPPPSKKRQRGGASDPTPPSPPHFQFPHPKRFVPPDPLPSSQLVPLKNLVNFVLVGSIKHVSHVLRGINIPVRCNVSVVCNGTVPAFRENDPEDPVKSVLEAMFWHFSNIWEATGCKTNMSRWHMMLLQVNDNYLKLKTQNAHPDKATLERTTCLSSRPITSPPPSPSLFELSFKWDGQPAGPKSGVNGHSPFIVFAATIDYITPASQEINILQLAYETSFPSENNPHSSHYAAATVLRFLEKFPRVRWLDVISSSTFDLLIPYFTNPFDTVSEDTLPGAEASTNGRRLGMGDPLTSLAGMRFSQLDFSTKSPGDGGSTFADILIYFVSRRSGQGNVATIANLVFQDCDGVDDAFITKVENLGVKVGLLNSN
ncbi:hypothetical protein CPC08DRAFT_703393 [Agrocybe pediades]|nr:hypothetical protein CPC08DRAFT_703393 [Agrocybe pediades]